MSIISRIFGSKKKNKYDDKPPMHGGDGLSEHSPIIVNCASMGMAQTLIDRFIRERCGKGCVRGMEYTISAPDNPKKLLSLISVKASDGSEYSFYFDLARPVAAAAKMLGI